MIADAGRPHRDRRRDRRSATAPSVRKPSASCWKARNFQAASVRKTSVALKLRTDASMRFEKSQDPVNTVRGLARAMELLEEVSPGIRLVGGLADRKADSKTPAPIELTVDWLSRKLGRAVDADEVRAILESLEFGVKETAPGHFSVTVPSWRATKDISIKDDLLEEVGPDAGLRFHHAAGASGRIRSAARRIRSALLRAPRARDGRRARIHGGPQLLVRERGDGARVWHGPGERTSRSPIRLRRIRRCCARACCLASGRIFSKTAGILASFRLFEIGREIHPRDRELPEEIPHFAAAMYAREGDGSASLFELKRLAECLMPGCEVQMASARPYEHPQRAASVVWRTQDADASSSCIRRWA